MSASSLARLEGWKTRFGADPRPLERLLARAARWRFHDAASLVRFHEAALFLRAYPPTSHVARLADAILFFSAQRVAALPESERSALAEPEVSGIAGSSITAVFSYEVARSLAQRYPRKIDVDWDAYDEPDRLGPLLARVLPMISEEWPVEAHIPYRQWISSVRDVHTTDLQWLLERAQADAFDALGLPLAWNFDGPVSRSRQRLPGHRVFCHSEPLLRRSAISLTAELASPPLPVRRVPAKRARPILDLILDTSAIRYRELYGFSLPDPNNVFRANAGRGVDVFFFGVPPEQRLPLRAYHAGMFFKNGVPAGYIELLSFFERAETGFNLYYTFREGETAWLYARLLRLFHQVLGVSCFSIDAYQIGLENPEAIDSGAFWFYRKLGFRPVDPAVATLTAREERRMRQDPAYRSPRKTLRRLAADCLIFESALPAPNAFAGAWDRFRIRNLALGTESGHSLPSIIDRIPDLDQWTPEERASADAIVQAKQRAPESRYLRLMQRHRRLRAALIALGSREPPLSSQSR